MKILLLKLITIVIYVNCTKSQKDPLVLIKQGLVRGQESAGGDYSSFLGVPYAQVKTDNAFGPAVPSPKFKEEIFNAYDGSSKCPQRVTNTETRNSNRNTNEESLDCLKLNIYVPNEASSTNPLPVLVWIHGGGFYVGSAADDGVPTLVNKGIVVVMMNYRLGPYGFMCVDSPLAPGNQGLKDQHMALQWIRNNIGAFGGNPYNVTLGGLSAGGASVLHQLFSTKQKLYHKAIAHSGVNQVAGLFVNGDRDAAVKLATHLGFNTSNTDEALSVLSTIDTQLIIAASDELEISFVPCKETSYNDVDNLIETTPSIVSNERKIKNIPILIGNTETEIPVTFANYGAEDPFEHNLEKNFDLDTTNLQIAIDFIKHFYIGDDDLNKEETSLKRGYFLSDFVFNHPIQRTITQLLQNNANPIYEYVFSYDDGVAGPAHAEDQKYLFQTMNLDKNNDYDLVCDLMTELWSNFIKYGNPTPQTTSLLPVTWEPVTINSRPYMKIDKELSMGHRSFQERMAFWDLFYSVYGHAQIYKPYKP